MRKVRNKSENVVKAIANSLKELNRTYIENHKKRDPKNRKPKNLYYGRSQTLSKLFEESLGKELAKIYPYDIHVDTPLTISDEFVPKDKKTIHPDIMFIEKKGETYHLKAIIELKIEIGRIDPEKPIDKIREKALKNATSGEYNTIVGAYSDAEKENNETRKCKIPKKYTKILLVAVDNKRTSKISSKLQKAYEDYNYKVLFLLNPETNPNTEKNIETEIIKEIENKEREIHDLFQQI